MKSVIAAIALFATVSHAGADEWYPKSTEFEGHIEVTRGRIIMLVEGEIIVCRTTSRAADKDMPWMITSRMKCDDGERRDWVQIGPDLASFNDTWFTKTAKPVWRDCSLWHARSEKELCELQNKDAE